MKLFDSPLSKNIMPFILLSIIIVSIYFNTLNNSFVWDDEYLIINNIFIKNPRYIKNIFIEPLLYKSCRTNYYRPIQTFSYLFDFHLWKLNPIGYHLTNISIHILNAILIYLLIDILFKDKEIALLTSLFFAVCPLHVSIVTYISGRADLMVTFFILSASLLFIKSISVKNDLYYLGSILCFLLALLSKEVALILLPILLLTHKVYETTHRDISKSKDAILRYAPFLLFSLAYIILRMTILNFSEGLPIEQKGNLYLKVITFCQIIVAYIKLIFVPINLYMQHRIQIAKTVFTPFAFFSLISVIFISIAIIKSSRRSPIIFWALSWFLITLLPVYFVMYSYRVYAKDFAMMAEHWLYIPLIGFFTFLSFLVCGLKKIRPVNLIQSTLKKIVIFPMALLIFYIFETIIINRDYKNSESLFNKILQYAPDNINARVNLPKFYLEQGNLDKAITGYTELLKLNKDLSYLAHSGLGTTYFKKGNFKEAIYEYKNAISKLQDTERDGLKTDKQSTSEILRKMGIVYYYQGLYIEAENELIKAMQINPLDDQAFCALGVVYAKQGRYTEALTNISKSLEINPFDAETYNNLGLVYAHIGNTAKAKEMWQKAIRINSDFIEARRNIQWAEGINK